MKKGFFILLTILVVGCVIQQEVRYYKSYNRSPEFKSFIKEDSYTIWYDENIRELFIELEKDSFDWKDVQKNLGTYTLDHLFYNRESGIFCVIAKNRYKISYDKILKNLKNHSNSTLVESDQRMVNNTHVLYARSLVKHDDNKTMLSSYYITYGLGSLLFMIGCPEDNYGENRKMIEKALNGIELN